MGGEPHQSPALGEFDARICPTCQQPLDTWQDECPACREPATLRLSVATEALPPVPAHLRDALDNEEVGPGDETEVLGASDVTQHGTNELGAEPGAHKPPVVPFDEDVSIPFPTVVGHFVPGGLAGGGAGGGGAGCGDGGC